MISGAEPGVDNIAVNGPKCVGYAQPQPVIITRGQLFAAQQNILDRQISFRNAEPVTDD